VLSDLALFEQQYPHPSPNKNYPSETDWLAYVNTTAIGSFEREFVAWVNKNYPTGFSYFTFTECETVYNADIHRIDGGAYIALTSEGHQIDLYFYHFVLK
jgi:hypothetical protein